MNGLHDMGGLHGFGAVVAEANEPVFHARWESRVFAVTQALDPQGIYSLDEYRHEIELMDPASYTTATYYGRWLFALERILARRRIVHAGELERRIADMASDAMRPAPLDPAARHWPLAEADKVPAGSRRKDIPTAPLFGAGDPVRVRNLQPPGHTRLAAYVRGRTGTVRLVNAEAWVLPDSRAHGRGENPQPVYNVMFAATELFGPDAETDVSVNVDLFEDYLEPA